VAAVLKSARMADFSPEQLGFLTFGRGIDTTRMHTELGFEPSFSTEQAFADFAAATGPVASPVERIVDGLAASLSDLARAGVPGG
jgi:UDP-glucose 4-epimerase